MCKLIKTPLSEEQKLRLINVLEINEKIVSADFVKVEGTMVEKINVAYKDHKESIYTSEEDLHFIHNGLMLKRN